MTATNDPADTVIEQAADVIRNVTASQYPDARDSYDKWARALHDAGLLADPADRDAVKWERDQFRKANEALSTRAVRAEAEVARLQQWKDEASPVMIGLQDLGKALGIPLGTRITGEVAAEKAAELRETIDRVRALADRWNTEWLESVRPEHRSKVRPAWAARGIWRALDGPGESDGK